MSPWCTVHSRSEPNVMIYTPPSLFSRAAVYITLSPHLISQLSKAGCSGILFWYFHIFLFNSYGCYLSCYIFSCCFIFASSHKKRCLCFNTIWSSPILPAGCLTLQREQQLSTFIISGTKSCECVLFPFRNAALLAMAFSPVGVSRWFIWTLNIK